MARLSRLSIAVRAQRMLRERKTREARRAVHLSPKPIAIDYLGLLLPELKRQRELIERYLLPAARGAAIAAQPIRLDASGIDLIESAVNFIEREMTRDGPSDALVSAQARTVARQVDTVSSRELSSQIRAKLDIDVVGTVPGLEDKVATFTRQNVQLIKSIPADYLHDVEQTVLRSVREGTRAEDIAAMLEDRFQVASNRAALIAQDQVGKFYGELARERQTNLGIDSYIWNNVGDERVSGNPGGKYPDAEPSHWDRQNESYKWSKPPEGGHPGQRPRCRCWAEPDLEGLL